ncbi:MAG TPA: methyltransferase domain-containing protein [Opitutaceae bacterium]|nr:methyltransferase domain-containing protein [Opitutaceae bacterium]
MPLSNLEYISLRLVRRFVLRDALLLRFGALFPYYRTNRNQVDPAPLVDDYARLLRSVDFAPQGKSILEIGVGRTNSTGYELAARFAPEALSLLEPFVEFAPAEDAQLLKKVATRHQQTVDSLAQRVTRLKDLRAIPTASIDLVLSASVLEHVSDPAALFAELKRVLKPGGGMLHLVDYRDHFFKYPYHFLQFPKTTWNRWLNPGDLPVWRVYDHVEQLGAAGFSVRLLEEKSDAEAFARLAPRLAADYRRDDPRVQIATAALWSVRSS